MESLKKLFSPVSIGVIQVKNRIVMPPMTTMMGADDGAITQRQIDYYEARAKGGAGLIIVEFMTVDRFPSYIPNALALWDDKFVPGLRDLVRRVHAHGAKIVPQIAHPGPQSLSFLQGVQPVGPSPIVCEVTRELCRELAVGQIDGIIEQFVEAARRAREGGCDGIELHAAHAYLLVGSFLSALRNRRTDAYGGTTEGRVKLLLQIIKAIRAEMGPDFAVIVRISGEEQMPGGRSIQETQYMARLLADAGVDALHISNGVYLHLQWRINPPMGTPLGINVDCSAAVKKAVDVPVIVVGRINNPRLAEDILDRNQADLVAMGRSLLADPDLPIKAAEGRFEDIAPCIGCGLGCYSELAYGRPLTCLINPAVGREKEMAISATAKSKKVLIAGGGPGGLEAARVAALRGHEVTLFDKATKLGGQFNLASVPPMKQEICQVISYLSTQAEKAGVRVELNEEVTPELIERFVPDTLIVATGGEPLVPDLLGVQNKNVATAHDVLAGKAGIGAKNVLVLGGGMVGCEIADFLAYQGDNPSLSRTAVTIVEMLPDIGLDLPDPHRMLLMLRLRDKGVKVITSAKVKEILDDGAVLVRDGQEETINGMDCVVLALGARSVDSLSEKAKDQVAEVYVIGDAKEPRRALEAIAEGAIVGRKI